jgi:crossover junction endodeoxyribonuclease RuvC
MKVLGIDPGYERLGIAVVEKTKKQKEFLVFSECFKTPSSLSFHERITLVGKELEHVIITHSPNVLSLETLFFSTNKKTALQVAHVRGVLMYVASTHNLPVYEYSPAHVKIATTGYGKSDKAHVSEMVKKLIQIDKEIKYDDEFDAIAVALTCLATEKHLR